MRWIKQIWLLAFLILTNACKDQTSLNQVDFLIGKWKVEGKESYESWQRTDNKLIGEVFKMSKGTKTISETIEIVIQKEQIVYIPTVFDQNEGKGIPFELKSTKDSVCSFENMEHDFPKKIQYKMVTTSELYVSVLGEGDQGFSYKLIKQMETK